MQNSNSHRRDSLLLVALVGVIAVFVAAVSPMFADARPAASPERQAAIEECKAEREADPEAFEEAYGKEPRSEDDVRAARPGKGKGKRRGGALRRCADDKLGIDREAIHAAKQECRAEREADEEAFEATYGEGREGKRACVDSKLADDESGEGEPSEGDDV